MRRWQRGSHRHLATESDHGRYRGAAEPQAVWDRRLQDYRHESARPPGQPSARISLPRSIQAAREPLALSSERYAISERIVNASCQANSNYALSSVGCKCERAVGSIDGEAIIVSISARAGDRLQERSITQIVTSVIIKPADSSNYILEKLIAPEPHEGLPTSLKTGIQRKNTSDSGAWCFRRKSPTPARGKASLLSTAQFGEAQGGVLAPVASPITR